MIYSWLRKSAVIVLVLAFVLAGSSALQAEDTLVIGQQAEAPGLHTLMETDVYAFERINLINEPLMVINRDLDLDPGLATDWEVSEDATRIDVELREGVQWHHGREFTAEDVKYTYEWILDEENPAENRDLYEPIEEIEIVDDHELVFHLEEPNAFLTNNMARVGIVPHDYHEEVGYEEFGQEPVGTGPYVHEEWVDDDYHLMSANEDYWDGEPNFSEIEFRPIIEASSRLLAFEAGEIDMFHGDVVPEELERLEEDPDFNVSRASSPSYTYIGMNQETTENPDVIQDIDFRRAVAHALNREGIVEHVLQGMGEPGRSPIIPEMAHFNDEIDYPEYDMEKAQEYIEQSDVSEGDEVNIYVSEGDTVMQIAEIMEYELSELGINVNVQVEEWGAFLDRVYDTDEYDMFVMGWAGQVDPDRATYRQFHSEGAANHTNFANERMDELLEEGRRHDTGSEESIEIYQEVQEILLEEHPKVYIDYGEEVAVAHPEFEGFEVHSYEPNTWLQLVNEVERVEE